MSTPFGTSISAAHQSGSRYATRPGQPAPPEEGVAPRVPEPAEPVEARTAARLIVTRGAVAGTIFPITRDDITIGRDDACDLVINDITVSRHHAEIQRHETRYTITDGGSLNGVYLNRRPIQHAQLSEGDEVWIGKARFTFHLPAPGRADTFTSTDESGGAEIPSPGTPAQRTSTRLVL